MLAKLYDWLDLALTFAAGKLLPMVVLAAIGILAVQVVLKLVFATLESVRLHLLKHYLVQTMNQQKPMKRIKRMYRRNVKDGT